MITLNSNPDKYVLNSRLRCYLYLAYLFSGQFVFLKLVHAECDRPYVKFAHERLQFSGSALWMGKLVINLFLNL